MTAPIADDVRLDLKSARVLCVDESAQGLDILGQILVGFGIQHITRAQSVDEARRALATQPFDLILVDAALEGNGHDLVRWLRSSTLEPNRYASVVVLAGHTPQSQIETARDCGSNFVVIKPISARTLLQRIHWLGRAGRMFVDSERYSGPDRRFRNEGVPGGGKGRRHDDLSVRLGDAKEPNMTQDDIDNLMKPQRVML